MRRLRIDLPHLAFVSALGGWSAWFCRDAWRSNAGVENLILIVPVSIVALLLFAAIALGCVSRVEDTGAATPSRAPLPPGMGRKVAGSMLLLCAFVVTGPWIGFDVACFLYILLTMLFLGERRPLVLLLVPLLFCAAAIYSFNNLLQTPLPLFFAPGEAP